MGERGWLMTRARTNELVAEVIMVGFSGGFLLCYIMAKIAVWPWGACSY
jgi:hypothetical protein